ncbi:MAG: transcription factor, partial [Treponema sp. GWB1_62_6]
LASSCFTRGPRIDSIDPRIGTMGEVLRIEGSGFGGDRGQSRVTIAGIAPTSSSYIEWSPTRISVRIPDFGESGLVYVHTDNGKSNAALFTNRESLPLPVSSANEGINPRIDSLENASGGIGSSVAILGRNFGSSRENGAVLFAWAAEEPPAAPASAQIPKTVEVSELEYGYEFWSDREIRVRVPDGAVSGNLIIRTVRGDSNPVFFQIDGMPGGKSFKERRSYVVNYSVDIKVARVSGPNALYLWVPRPATGSAQKEAKLLSRSLEPFVEGRTGASLYQFKDLAEDGSILLSSSYLVDVYATSAQMKPQAIKKAVESPVRNAYTLSTPLIPADDKEIVKLADRLAGKENNPWIVARKYYDWMRTELDFSVSPSSGGAMEALTSGKADAYSSALLFCALARASGIPAVPSAGFLVDRTRASERHFWSEFWIDGFGWVPVDIALGARWTPAGFSVRADAGDFYFGNLDNQHVAFSRGAAELSPMDPRGRTAIRERGYSFQNLWEEATGGLDSYSSLWSDLTVTGVY